MRKEINQTWLFQQTPQEVWEYLTKPDLLAQWLMETDFQPTVGHKFRFICEAIAYCEVLEVQPFSRLSYSWQGDSIDGSGPFHSTVTWTLTPDTGGTRLQLVHNGFRVLEDLLGHEKGWVACGSRLSERLNPVNA
jgi:uncharacterized protein YndB with AHSA1/START domain